MPLCHMPGIFPNIAQTISIISKMFYNYAFLPSFLSTPFFSILHRVVHSTSYSCKLSIIIHWALKAADLANFFNCHITICFIHVVQAWVLDYSILILI